MNQTSTRAGSRGRFAHQALKLATGTAIAQGLTLLAAPALTRIYGPDAFGVAALFQSLVGIVAAVACLRYEMAIMLPAADRRAADMFGLSLGLTVMMSVVTALPAILAARPIARALNAPGIAPWLWLVPVGVLLGGFTLALNNWETRTGRFGRLSVARVVAAVVTVTAMLFLGLAGHPTGGSRIVAMVLGSLAFCVLVGSLIWRDDRGLFRSSITRLGILAGARRFRRFPVFDTWSMLMNAVSWQLPALLLSRFFNAAVVGHYALGFRTLQLPMSLVGTAIGQVFFRRAAIARHEGRLAELVENAFGQLAKLGLFPLLLLSLVGRELFLFVFGPEWAEAGVFAQILAPWVFFWFISSPLSTLISVLEKQRFGLFLNIAILATRLGSLVIGGWLGDARLGLGLFAATGVLLYGYLSFRLMVYAGVPWSRTLRRLLSSLLAFLPAGAIVLALKLLAVRSWILLTVSGILLAVYALFLFLKDPQTRALFSRSAPRGTP